ncbi:MAG: hypothetical protein ABI852_15970 [Gemmatimonadaceae bacterium]
MKTPCLMRALAIATLGVSANACNSPTQSTAADLSVNMTASRAQFRSGDTTTFTTSIVNNGETTVVIAESSCVAYFEVSSGSHLVAPGQPICAAVAFSPIVLAAGETRQFKEVWHGENRTLQVMLNSGAYSVRSRVNTSVGAIVSTPLSIQILP